MPNRAALALLLLATACESDSGSDPSVDARVPMDATFFDAGPLADARPQDAARDAAPDARANEFRYCLNSVPIPQGRRVCQVRSDCGSTELCSFDGSGPQNCFHSQSNCTTDADCGTQICDVDSCGSRVCMTPCSGNSCDPYGLCNGRVCQPVLESCTRSADCLCGTCVESVCRVQPGVCVQNATVP